MKQYNWRYAVVGNIKPCHIDDEGNLRYGSSAFTGGTKVYLCGKYWSRKDDNKIAVIGLTRSKKWQVPIISADLIENVRLQKVFKPSVLELMNHWEFSDCWWGDTLSEKEDAQRFIRYWNGETGKMNLEDMKNMIDKCPPDLTDFDRALDVGKYSPQELAELAYHAADNCFGEYSDFCSGQFPEMQESNLHGNYLPWILRLLLWHGLDPNIETFSGDTALQALQWVNQPNVAADTLRLLLEHGGNPNLQPSGDSETLFDTVAFRVSYDEYTHNFFHTVQFWLVLMAYGGCWEDGQIPLTMLNGHEVSIFKEFEHFDYTIESLPEKPHTYGNWIMHIFDKRTGDEVAVYK